LELVGGQRQFNLAGGMPSELLDRLAVAAKALDASVSAGSFLI
jgi:hypothetical protein